MTDPNPTRRRFRPTPGWLIFGLLVVECLLWLSERIRWFGFNCHKGWTVLIVLAVVAATILLMLLWFAVALIFRWRFQFSIRTLLILTAVVALPCSWMAVEMKAAREQTATVAAIEKLGGRVEYDWSLGAKGESFPNTQPPEPAWLRNLLEDSFFTEVTFVGLDDTETTDASLANITRFPRLYYLSLDGTKITDASLAQVAGLPQLGELWLARTRVTDAGLKHLVGLTQLYKLSLIDTQVTDAGLEQLARLAHLEEVTLARTKVTDVGVAKLRQALPNCITDRP